MTWAVRDAIDRSGVLNQFPEVDLQKQKVGVFSKVKQKEKHAKAAKEGAEYRAL